MRGLNIATWLVMICSLSLVACAQDKPVTTKPIGMANPASQYCVGLGGQLEIKRQADGGEYGLCHFPNGSTIEECVNDTLKLSHLPRSMFKKRGVKVSHC